MFEVSSGGFFPISLADPAQIQPMQGGLGAGVDPDCLKAGGAAGGVHENRWDPADYPTLLSYYADPFHPVTNPGGLRPPILYDLPGSSPQNALENHPANQGLFSWVCLATIGFLPRVAPESCLVAMFGSAQPLSPAAPFLALSEVLGALFAGEHNATAQGFFTTFAQNTKGAPSRFTPVRNLNDDASDGIITAQLGSLSGNPSLEINTPGANPGNDMLTLDQVLSNEQRALFGCGPFYGTRCDSGRGGIVTNPFNATQSLSYQAQGFSAGGGIDLLNSEASALLQAWPGIFGTDASWATTNRELGPQPGTIGFAGSPACTREVGGETIVLPGCRGVQSLVFDDVAGYLDGDLRRRLRRREGRLRVRGDAVRIADHRRPRGRLARRSQRHAAPRRARARPRYRAPTGTATPRCPPQTSRCPSPARGRSSTRSRGARAPRRRSRATRTCVPAPSGPAISISSSGVAPPRSSAARSPPPPGTCSSS